MIINLNIIFMKKILLTIILFFAFVLNTNAWWYGNHSVSAPNPWNTTLTHWSTSQWWYNPSWPNKWTWCDDDNDWVNDSWYNRVAQNNSSNTNTPHNDSELEISGTTIYCLYWDGQAPTWSVTYYSWWTNNTTQTVNYSATDAWWSKIKKIELQWRTSTSSPNFTSGWSSRSTLKTDDNINSDSYSSSYTYTHDENTDWKHRAYEFRIIITDIGWNSGIATWTDRTKIDLSNPNSANITSNPLAWTDILATTSYNFAVTAWSDIWSPIVMVQWFFEDYNSCSNWWLSRSSTNSSTLSINPNISKANLGCDWNSSIWWRNYTFKITYVKDQAWNSIWTYNASSSYWWVKSFTYDIYSNHIDSFDISWTHNVITNELDDNKIADWQDINLKIELKDRYWNEIINSTWINRDINFDFNYKNTLYADQYNNTWNALYMKQPSSSDSINNNKLTVSNSNQIYNWINTHSTDWKYNFIFKAYTPTYKNWANDWRQLANKNSDFIINLIDVDINSDLWNNTDININNSNIIDSEFRPLYKTTFNWEQATYWFIEWVIQKWNINITNNNSWKSTSNKELYLEFWKWYRLASIEVDMYTTSTTPEEQVVEGHQTNVINLEDLIASYPSNVSLDTKIIQNPWQTLANLQEYYLSTHFAYTIDGHNVVYNSSVLGRDNYFDTPPAVWNATQVWIKVLWITYSKKQKDIITNQEQNDIHILWTINKSKLKESIRKNIYKIISNVSWNQWWTNNDIDDFGWTIWDNSNKGKRLYDNKVLYFDLSWVTEKVIVTNWWTVSGQKTLIVKWWDLYIKWDIKYNSNSDILGIAVLKDTNWKWGNIYIAPNVKYIWAQIYADKAIFSWYASDADWENVAAYPVNTDQSTLKDQLYIKWQVFSENTIWGSRKNPPICPYYDKASCNLDKDKAQKYDLNYLRRYFIYDSNNNWTIDDWDIAANWWTNYRGTFDTSVYPYARYPVVIDYNPIVQITPPPLFDN